MITEWDLTDLVSASNEIENTQPTASRPTGAVSSLVRCAVIFAASSLIPAMLTAHEICPAGATSQTVCVLNQLKLQTRRPVRISRVGNVSVDKSLPVARTSQQLAKSFRSMLREVDPAEYVDSDYTFR